MCCYLMLVSILPHFQILQFELRRHSAMLQQFQAFFTIHGSCLLLARIKRCSLRAGRATWRSFGYCLKTVEAWMPAAVTVPSAPLARAGISRCLTVCWRTPASSCTIAGQALVRPCPKRSCSAACLFCSA